MARQWSTLRAWEGSQELGFEELCCQLAAAEQMPDGCRFKRKGAPDAGVECFWTMPNGDEWAWQAKFFQQIQDVQWRDLDESVQQALNKHPRIVRYWICLPIDFADPRLIDKRTKKKRTFAQDAWDLRVAKWKQWAKRLGMEVRFEYWGNHEIWNRLSIDEHRGRLLFWFNELWFGDEWFRQRIEEAHENAGKRYIPSLHVALDLEHAFDALGRTDDFFRRLSDRLGSVRREFDNLRVARFENTTLEKAAGELNQVVHDLSTTRATTQSASEMLPLEEVSRLADRGCELAFRLDVGLRELGEKCSNESDGKESYSYERHRLYLLQDRLAELNVFVRSPAAIVANTGVLLLVGDAGTGKTHMFCEVARRRVEARAPTVLFLAEQFVPGEPWSQMLKILGVRCDRDQFLGALEAVAEARGTRALILLDALNEEHGLEIWPKYLPGMLAELRLHPRIGIALSVRSSYEKPVIPEQLEADGRIIRFVHSGFEGHEDEGVDRYFQHYGIALPSFPILDPEFSNPLFLRVLCEGIRNKALSRIPEGLGGFTAVFQFFLDSVNEKLARRDLLDYDPKRPVVMQAVGRLAEAMVAKEAYWLDRDAASEILETVLPRQGFDKSLFRRLVDEGVLAEELIWVRRSGRSSAAITSVPAVRFQYQRFADYLVVRHLLSPHIKTGQVEGAFEAGRYLGKILADPVKSRQNQGIVEALAVLIPESTGRELPTLAPRCSSFDSVKNAVSASLVWRRAKSVSPSTWSYIEQNVLPDANARRALLRTLILVAPDPSHPYNARFLSGWLLPMRLVDRDALWSTFLAIDYGDRGACTRLLRWTESVASSPQPDDTPVRLAALAVAWFLTSSNRPLRDRATKALVSLLTYRLSLAVDLIMAFTAVNDAYVLERVAAAAYGAAMRSLHADHIARLALVCYETFFKHTRPPVNALSRDYLRGILELALHLQPSISIDPQRIRPPYEAPLPEGFEPNRGSHPDLDWSDANDLPEGLKSVSFSVTNDDFNSYILRSLCDMFLATKLGDRIPPTRREACEQFEARLSAAQAVAWEKYKGPRLTIDQIDEVVRRASDHHEGGVADKLPDVEEAREEFEATLSDRQKDLFRREIRAYVEEGYPAEARTHVSLAAVQHFILERVFAMGWRQELDDFDRSSVVSSSRSEHKVERIGKKYQWIAFYELIGVLADNLKCGGDSYNAIGHYEGPWQVTYGRNIDPSLMLRSKPDEAPERTCWWVPKQYDSWAEELDELAWISLDSDIPKVDKEFLVVRDSGQLEWVVLEGHYKWTQPTAPGREYLELPQRQISYTVTSCLVRAKYASPVLKELLNLELPHLRFLQPRQTSDPFLGEMHWAPAYMSQLTPYHGYDEWIKDSLPHPVLVTTERYYAEPGSFDASMDEAVTLLCPSHWIVEKMGLRWNGVAGEWCGGSPRRTVFRDPSAHTPGPTALLASRNDMEQFLRKQGCELIWIITGTKWAIGGGFPGRKPTGRRLICGAIRMKRNSLSGNVRSWLELPRR